MDNVKLYRPYKKQIPIHKACEDEDSTFFITTDAGRQAGKTALAQQQALYWALNSDKVIVYWVSPTASQATKVYNQLLDMVVGMPFLESYKGSKADTEMLFSNGSKILFRSAAQEDSLRGETIEYLIIDEAAFIKESVFGEILLPMLNVRGRKCLIISTPKGKNWFFNQYQKGFVGDKNYKSFKFTSQDNPYANPIIIQIAKENLPDVLFRQEYLAEFVDITVIDDQDNVVWFDRFNQVTAPQLKQRVIDANNLWKPKKLMIEENNQGLPIIDDLKIIHKLNNIVGFKTTAVSKPEIINNLINAFASKKIHVPNDEIYRSELETFTMTISPTGKPKFEAANGFHDDIPMSLAITWECANKYKYNGSYNFN